MGLNHDDRKAAGIKAIFFDLDDTLFDRVSAHRQAIDEIVGRFPELFQGLPHGAAFRAWEESDRLAMLDFNSGAPSQGLRDKISRRFLNLLGLPEEFAGEITAAYVEVYPRLARPVPGGPELVRRLSQQISVGVITNGLPDVQYRKLAALGILELLKCTVLSEEIGIRKPDPRIFQHAANLIGVPPPNCFYVGDAYLQDIVGARAAGMVTCWLNRSGARLSTPDPEYDFTITGLSQIPPILKLETGSFSAE
jgi:HAD superfamily hydrolase (TIGR01509 family)